MGCHESRKNYSQEEIALMSEELMLNFHSNSPHKAYCVFKTKSRNGYLNDVGFAEAAEALNLTIKNVGTSLMVEEFFRQLRGAKGYSEVTLSVLSVLLGTGSEKEKAETLFNIYDETYSLTLPRAQVQRMVSDFLDLSIDQLGILVTNDQSHASGTLRNREYLKGLRSVKNQFQEMLIRDMLQGRESISRDSLVNWMCTAQGSKCLSSSNLRVALSDFRKELNRLARPK